MLPWVWGGEGCTPQKAISPEKGSKDDPWPRGETEEAKPGQPRKGLTPRALPPCNTQDGPRVRSSPWQSLSV